jgi:ligand-binding SRPBCC domain-containing protein
MTIHTLERTQRLPISCAEAWGFFSDPRNLAQLTPPEIGFESLNSTADCLYEGQILTYRISVLPLVPLTWVTEIKAIEVGKSFVDEQRFGPYQFWHHRHTFEEIPGGVLVRDRAWLEPVRYDRSPAICPP